MRVHVLYFGVLKEVAGVEREEVALPEGSCVEALMGVVRARGWGQPDLWKTLALAVNREYVRDREHILRDGDEVALLPPVSGGSSAMVQPCR